MKIFRKIRISALNNNKVFKYLIYAIGEILLIIIGILIAVSINNKNEANQLDLDLQSIYKTIQNDLERDTLQLARMIYVNNYIDSLTNTVLKNEIPLLDTINKENINDCDQCYPLHSLYDIFSPNLGGLQALREFKSIKAQDSLSFGILNFYTGRVEELAKLSNSVGDIALDNLRSLEQYAWYTDYVNKKFNLDQVSYFLHNQEYKNKLATFQILNFKNLNQKLLAYKRDGIKLINQIENRTK